VNKSRHTIAVLIAFIAITSSANATQGYFTIGNGAVDDGLAGAGVALPLDATIGGVNPAGIVRVGNQYEIGGALFQPSRQYQVTGTPSPSGIVKSGVDSFGLPNLAYTHRLTTNSAIGFNIFGNGGLNTSYPGSVSGGSGTFYGGGAGVNIEQLFIVPSYSYSFSSKWAVGASLVGVYQVFSATGLKAFGAYVADGDPNDLTNNGNDSTFGIGGKLGVLYNASSTLAFGAAYESKTSGDKFDKYSDLFANHGSFDVPATVTAGLAWKTSPSSVLAADVQYIKYSDVAAVGDSFSNLTSGSQSGLLGGSNGAGFGWKDTTYYKLGYQHDISRAWILRGGAAYGHQPISSSEVLFNILAPGVTEWHYALGASDKITPKGTLNFAAIYAPTTTVSGPNPLDTTQTISLSMKQLEVEASYSVKY